MHDAWCVHIGHNQQGFGFLMKKQQKLASQVLSGGVFLNWSFGLSGTRHPPCDTSPTPWHAAVAFSRRLLSNLQPLADRRGELASA